MKCKIHVIHDIENYESKMERHQRDPDIFPVPEVEISYSDYNIPDEFILGYRILNADESKNGKKGIYIMTDLHEIPYFVIDHTDQEEMYLDELIDIKNKQFRNL
jgi:hypothetical protein